MTQVYLIYNAATGSGEETRYGLPEKPEQLAAWENDLRAKGRFYIEVPDGTNGANTWIDLSTMTLQPIGSRPAIPDIIDQLVAGLINNGTVDASVFHPVTIADMNQRLASANLTPANTPIKAGSAAP